ncbi:DUF4221 family protein [Marivirga arenosa]|uniref:DUF4221 family protein n=1 Tax=Marivirga arenosa TaxID=3059076 RepID=A0AA49GGG1_9BACT|nr:DUF4221 family protein [Marivirga sp. BKB1-2]WKK81706.2 DUF4221 family protein [Marivirga sp. BKB1-2]
MEIKKIFFLLIITFFIYSCSDKIDSSKEPKIKVARSFLELKVNDSTSNISRGLQAFNNEGHEILFNINWGLNSLQIYNLEDSKLIKEIFFETEGEKSVGRIFGFHVHSLDSIFLFSQRTSDFSIIDTAYNIKDKIEYTAPDVYSNAFVHNSYFLSTPILIDNKLIVKTHIQGNYRSMTNAELEKKSISYSVDIKSGETELLVQKYPEDYLNEGLKFYEYSMAGHEDQIVFSFFGDHRLFYTSKEDENKLQSTVAKSKYLADKLPLFPVNGAREETYEYLFASDHYESLLYDKYRDLYYRFAYPQQKFENIEDLQRFRDAPDSFSLMILDGDLNILEEILFDESRLVPNNVFVGKKGLYISTSHPLNPEMKEDKMIFDLVEVKM